MQLRIAVTVLLTALGTAGCSGPQKAANTSSNLKFSIPPDWIREDPSQSSQHSRYRLSHAAGDTDDAELIITFSGDENASVQKAIDAWTAQFERPDGTVAPCQIVRREVNGIPLTVLDSTGTYIPQNGTGTAKKGKSRYRMLAAIAETEHGPWFFRLIGPGNTVSVWEPSFQSFLDTIE
jgi:hypothetical protein